MVAWTIYLSFAGRCAGNPAERQTPCSLAGAQRRLAGRIRIAASCGVDKGTVLSICRGCSMESLLLAADGSARAVLLTGLAAVAGVLFSWNIELAPTSGFSLSSWRHRGLRVFSASICFYSSSSTKCHVPSISSSHLGSRGASTGHEAGIYSFAGSAMVPHRLLAAYALGTTPPAYRIGHADSLSAFRCGASAGLYRFCDSAGMCRFHTWAHRHVRATAASMLLAAW